jgi:TRAP-type mannitol/chloroaromatic compound transport system permease small subunit
MRILACIDAVSDWTGKVIRWLGLLLSLAVIYEVISRYAFNRPTIWAFDTAMMLTSILFLLPAAYMLKENAHIRVDVLLRMFPVRVQQVIECIFYLVFFFPFTLVMVWFGSRAARNAWLAQEISNTSQWGEPIAWWKWVIPLAFFLLLLQGIAEFSRTLAALAKPTREIEQ